jgi:hypothetical protein
MASLKRIMLLSGLTAFLGALAFAAPANANVKAICMVDGEAKAVTTNPTFKKYVQVSGGGGTFTFTSINLLCFDIGSTKGPGNVHMGSANASGTFKNATRLPDGTKVDTPCGQGKVLGKITAISAPGTTKFNSVLNAKFALEFGSPMSGLFYWHTAGPPSKPTSLGKSSGTLPKTTPSWDNTKAIQSPTKPYRWAGNIQLSPSQTKNDAGKVPPAPPVPDKCAKAFHINGTVIVHEA